MTDLQKRIIALNIIETTPYIGSPPQVGRETQAIWLITITALLLIAAVTLYLVGSP